MVEIIRTQNQSKVAAAPLSEAECGSSDVLDQGRHTLHTVARAAACRRYFLSLLIFAFAFAGRVRLDFCLIDLIKEISKFTSGLNNVW